MTHNIDDHIVRGLNLSERYTEVLEVLSFKRTDNAELYYGGPITRKADGIRWVQPLILFEQEKEADR